jgi:hypothetical protein
MTTHIRVSGLSYFCTDAKLLQAFTPFGRVVLAQVLRDECGAFRQDEGALTPRQVFDS